MRDFTAIN